MTRDAALETLAERRSRIDVLDLRILALLNERTSIVEEIGQVKRLARLPVYEPQREDAVFQNVTRHNTGPLTGEAVQRIFEAIMDEMREVQRAQIEAGGEPA